jgi:predicted nuclease of predicted toxin-antitoxin system
MKLLVDMNLSPAWVDFLILAGVEAVHWSTVGPVNAADQKIMEYAVQLGFVVLTHDLDFSAILAASGSNKPSVAQIRADDLSTGVIGRAVVDALRRMEVELDAGALLTIDPIKARMRLLPLLPRR